MTEESDEMTEESAADDEIAEESTTTCEPDV